MHKSLLTIALLGTASIFSAVPAIAAEDAAKTVINLETWPVPDVDALPDDKYGKLVRYGRALTIETYKHIGPEVADPKMRYAGNNLACASCHQEGATLAWGIPWVGVPASFPQYRGREHDISTVEERVNGCMQRSMAGDPLPLDSREMKAYVAYMHFLSRGIPIGAEIKGQGMKPMKMPNRRADPIAGEKVYARRCAKCHGSDGQGERIGKAGDREGYDSPPLWGNDSFNTGAGMNRLVFATRFIKHNMVDGKLSDDEAYDVAAYVVSQPRPAPKSLDLSKDFPARFNKPVDAAFPPYLDGVSADQHKYGPFPPLVEKMKALKEQMQAGKTAK